ncbi:MAG: nucleotidyltransferase family protein [Candidatus Nanopelagicales bacterium]|nr:nucleotidyltransferase family protein [Candidatus Nanopelagicales bacterium]
MTPSLDQLREHRAEISMVLKRHHAVRARVFGSVARGEAGPESDVDLLVRFETGSSLFDLMDLQDELQEMLGVSVDVVSEGGLKDRDDLIRREAVDL